MVWLSMSVAACIHCQCTFVIICLPPKLLVASAAAQVFASAGNSLLHVLLLCMCAEMQLETGTCSNFVHG